MARVTVELRLQEMVEIRVPDTVYREGEESVRAYIQAHRAATWGDLEIGDSDVREDLVIDMENAGDPVQQEESAGTNRA